MIESAEEFIRLRESGDGGDYQRLKKEEAPAEVWRELVAHHPDMRFWVAFNRTVPADVLRQLAKDADWRVRDKVAGRRDTPPDVLGELARDAHDAVVSSVAGNPSTPDDALRVLAAHPWDQVSDTARKRLTDPGHG
ncbi:hypothetical protein ACFZBP_04805 [Streptomyces sp. NPDC008086]|uniref:hypothetical protein n=1 Tax=Streptomyces sp. NPDC008086 TaxID=3364807 RepID=UPI0036E07C2D